MVTVLDTHRQRDRAPAIPKRRTGRTSEVLRKPDWIRVKAPTSPGYAETREIVKDEQASSPSARRPAARTSASAGTRSTPPS